VVNVPNPRRPFRLNVGFIVHQPVGYSHEFDFDFPKIQIADDLDLTNFSGIATVGRTPQGLLVQADFSADMRMECVRCLSKYDQLLNWSMTELYAFTSKSLTESGLLLPEDAHIDLQPLIRQDALLEVPINPICKPDCKGLCPICGQDLNKRDCGHRPPIAESPFSALKDLLKE
jgi:uncharacterized protein